MLDLAELFLRDDNRRSLRALQDLLSDLPLALGQKEAASLLAFLHLSAGQNLDVDLESDPDGHMTLALRYDPRGTRSGGRSARTI